MCERNIDGLTGPTTQACALILIGTPTGDLSLCRTMPEKMSHTGQGVCGHFFPPAYTLGSGMPGSYGRYAFNIVRNCPAIFPNSCTMVSLFNNNNTLVAHIAFILINSFFYSKNIYWALLCAGPYSRHWESAVSKAQKIPTLG